MKALLILIAVTLSCLASSNGHASDANQSLQTYGIHLYFNETEFVDVMSINEIKPAVFEGSMHVPNDFDGKLENIHVNGLEISFDLFVPKNSARPQDLIFHYKGFYFDVSKTQLMGFVTIKGTQNFVASFVGFKRN